MTAFPTLALILSGGATARINQEKGLAENEGVEWAQTLLPELESLGLLTYVSISTKQQAAYQSVFPVDQLILDEAEDGINGPLTGILTAYRQHPQHHLLVIAGDMPKLGRSIFQTWQAQFGQQYPETNILVCQTANRLQPLCGIYGQAALQQLEQMRQQGKLQHRSMHHIVESLPKVYRWTVPDEQLSRFDNYHISDDS